MTDNTIVSTTDTIRDLDRANNGIKTQVSQIDFGGPSSNATGQVAESLLSITNPLPVNLSTRLFSDTFDSTTLDLVTRWIATVSSTGNPVAASIVPGGYGTDGGAVTLNSGTVAGGWSALQSIPFFDPTEPGFLLHQVRHNFEFPLLTTGYRFSGYGIRPPNPTIALPVVNGVGYEITTGGLLFAVTYVSGVRTFIQAVTVPADANSHKYFVQFQGPLTYWYYDTPANVVAAYLTGASGPNVNTMPILELCISNGGTAVSITNNGCSVADTIHTTFAISDGQFGFRKASVKPSGATPATSDNALVVSLSPNSAPLNVSTNVVDTSQLSIVSAALAAQELNIALAASQAGFFPYEQPPFLGV